MPEVQRRSHGFKARVRLTNKIATLHSPAVMKNGTLESAERAAKRAVGNHQRSWPERIMRSAKKRNQTVTTRQKPSVEPRPAVNTIIGWARKNIKLHQAAWSPTYCFANRKKGHRPVAKTARETMLAQPYQAE